MAFRFKGQKVGLTYSQVDGLDITTESLLKFAERYGTVIKYKIGKENHKDGGTHFHCYFQWAGVYESRDARCFDHNGRHPNIQKCPGIGWWKYCSKDGDFVCNCGPSCKCVSTFELACRKRTWEEAEDVLWQREPKWMLTNSEKAETAFKRRFVKKRKTDFKYYGPYTKQWPDCDPNKYSIVIRGESGLGKTNWLKYVLPHLGLGGYFYVKGSISALRHYDGSPWIIMDDIRYPEKFKQFLDLMDRENPGRISVSPTGNYDFDVPEAKYVFLTNGELLDDINTMDIYGNVARRMQIYDFKDL